MKSWQKKYSKEIIKRVKMGEGKNIDNEILKLQNSTKTTIKYFCPLHDKLRMKYGWYYKWHLNPLSKFVHSAVLSVYIFLLAFVSMNYSGMGLFNFARAASFTSIHPGNWSDVCTWGTYCENGLPSPGDDATISTAVTLSQDLDFGSGTIIISSGGSLDTTASNYSIIAGSIIINSSGELKANGSTITLSGDVTNNCTSLLGSGFVADSSTLILNGTNQILSGTKNFVFNNLTLDNGSVSLNTNTTTIQGDLNVTGELTIASGKTLTAPSISINANSQINGDGTFSGNTAIQTINLADETAIFAPSNVTYSLSGYGNQFSGTIPAISYQGTGNFKITAMGPYVAHTYTHTIGTGELKIAGNLVIDAFYDTDTVVLKNDTNNTKITISGNVSTTGDGIKNYIPGTEIIDFNGSGTQSVDASIGTFNNMSHSGSGTLQLAGAIDVNGTFANSDGTFDANNQNMNFAGDFTNSGDAAFAHGSGTLTFDGTTILTDTSSAAASLGDLVVSGTVNLGSGVIINSASGAGTLNQGDNHNLTIAGTGTPLSVNTFNGGTNGSTTIYSASSAANIATYPYNNLQVSGATTFSLAGNLTNSNSIQGNLTIDSGSTLGTTASNYNLSCVDVTINGILTANNSTITASGSWDHSNGTFTEGNSTIKLTGASTANFGGPYGGASKQIYNLVVDSGENTVTLTNDGVRIASGGKITLNSGILNDGQIQLYGKTDISDVFVNNGVTYGDSLPSVQIFVSSSDAGSPTLIPPATAQYPYPNLTIYGSISGGNAYSQLVSDTSVKGNLYITCYHAVGSSILNTDSTNNYNLSVKGDLLLGPWGTTRPGQIISNSSNISVEGNATIYAGDGTTWFNKIEATGGSIDIEGNVTINDIFNAGSANIDVAGNWDQSNGVFNSGTSTVTLSGSGTITTNAVHWSAEQVFYNLVVDTNGTITLGNSLRVNNQLNFANGSITSPSWYSLEILAKDANSDPCFMSGNINYLSQNIAVVAFVDQADSENPDIIPEGDYPNLQVSSSTDNDRTYAQLTGNLSTNGYMMLYGSSSNRGVELNTDSISDYSISVSGNLFIGYAADNRSGILNINDSSLEVNGYIKIRTSDVSWENSLIADNATITIAGDLTNSDNITAGNSTINIGGDWDSVGGSFDSGSSTVNFTKSSSVQTLTSSGSSFNNVTHSGLGILQLQDALAISGNLSNSAGVFDANGQNVSVERNWEITGGSFSAGSAPGSQTVNIVSDGTSVVSGNNSFNNLNIDSSNSTAGKTVSFASGTTQTVNGTVTLAGASGKVLTLNRSGGSGSDQYTIAIPTDYTSGQYISVTNSNITGGTITPGSYVTVTDGGNNTGWDFDTDSPIITLATDPAAPNGSNGYYITSAPEITISANDQSESGVANIYYRWGNEGEYLTYSDPITAPEGTTTLYSYAIDNIGNSGADTPNTQEYKVDLAMPVVDIYSDPSDPNGNNGWYKNNVPAITLGITDSTSGGASIYYKWDSDNYAEYSEGFNAGEGVHTLYYYGFDNAGNQSSPVSREFKVDTQSPEVSISIDPENPDGDNGFYAASAPDVTLSATESGSGLSSIKYKWDSGEYNTYTNPVSVPEGISTIYYYATDNAGNDSDSSSSTYKVDLTSPIISQDPLVTSPTNNLNVKFSWTKPIDVSDIAQYAVFIGSDSGKTDIRNDVSTNNNYWDETFSQAGKYYFRFKAKNGAGLWSDYSSEIEVLIDMDAPVLKINNLTNDQYITTKNTKLTGTSSDSSAGIDKVQLKIDDGDWEDAASDNNYSDWYFEWNKYAEGLHKIEAKAVDNAGNTKNSSVVSVTVDTIAPSVPGDFRLFNISNQTAKVYATYLDFAASIDETSGVKKYEVYKNGEKIIDIDPNKNKSNSYYTGNDNQPYYFVDQKVSSGTYSYKVKVTDDAGNISETSELSTNTAGEEIESASITEAKGTSSNVVTEKKTSAIISWKTTYPATSLVEYGESANYGNKTELDTNLNQGHSILLSDLKPNTTYHAKVTSKDIYGREMSSADFTFTTKPAPEKKSVVSLIVNTLRNFFNVLIAKGANYADQDLSKLQGFSNNLLVTDVSYKEKNFYQNVLTFEKGKKVEKSTNGKNYSTVNSSDNYYLDKNLNAGNNYYYRLDDGMPVVRKPLKGDDSTLSVTDANVLKESVLVTEDKVQLSVNWKTNRGSTSQVEFGTSSSYGQTTKEDSSLNMGHNITLEDLRPDTTYHFRAISKDSSKNVAKSEDFTFTTPVMEKEKSTLDIIVETLQKVFATFGNLF